MRKKVRDKAFQGNTLHKGKVRDGGKSIRKDIIGKISLSLHIERVPGKLEYKWNELDISS